MNQVSALWGSLQSFQKGIVLLLVIGLFGFLAFLGINGTQSTYVALFSPDRMQTIDMKEVRTYLDGIGIPYKIQNDQTIMVPRELESKVRMEMALYGLPRAEKNKGFELFDNTTWIKGEKELQVLEVRALIGQLEQDIAQFDNVRSANVVIDIPSTRPFAQTQGKTKASVQLNLWPGARLSSQELRAMTFHVSAAVRGLQPNMVAISDTSGKLYQSIDPDGEMDLVRTSELAFEEYIKGKIDGLLANTIGPGNYYTTVQAMMSREKRVEERKVYSGTVDGANLGAPVVQSISESSQKEVQGSAPLAILGRPFVQRVQGDDSRIELTKQMAVPVNQMHIQQSPGKVESLSIGVLLNASAVPEAVQARMRNNVEAQLRVILEGYDVRVRNAITFTPFASTPTTTTPLILPVEEIAAVEYSSPWKIVWVLIAMGLLGALIWLSLPKEEKEERVSPDLESLLDNLRENVTPSVSPIQAYDADTFAGVLENTQPRELAEILSHQSPQTIALIFLYLTPQRAYQILSFYPEAQQEVILSQLDAFTDFDDDVKENFLERIKDSFEGLEPQNAEEVAARIRAFRKEASNPEKRL